MPCQVRSQTSGDFRHVLHLRVLTTRPDHGKMAAQMGVHTAHGH